MSSGVLFEQLQLDGKRLAAEGKLIESLRKFEDARKIMETPKILNRIQKLKDAISRCRESPKLPNSAEVKSIKIDPPKETPRKLYNEYANDTKTPGSFKTPRDVKTQKVLSQIDNFEFMPSIQNNKVVTNPAELSPEKLKRFDEIKKNAMELSFDGKFKEALEAFTEALKICNCPKVKKYIQEMEIMTLKHEEKLQKFQHLSDTGKRLASGGRPTESLKKFKDAYAVYPSPKVSKIIQMMEVKAETPAKSHLTSPDFSNEDFVLPKVPQRKVESGSSNSDDSNFQSPVFKKNKTNTSDPSDLSPDKALQYKNLYKKARENAASGNLKVALDALNKAKAICPSDKILKRIKDIKEHIKSTSEEEENDKMVAVAEGFYVFHEIYQKLYPYQRLGVAWMWELFKKRKGGVLGDDMGLGKTFQVIAFLSGLIDADHAKHVLCVMPVSLLTNWENEFQKWCPGISVCVFHGGSKKDRERNILRVQRRGHVLLTSYGMVLNSFENLSEYEGRQFIWDYVILDEGHKIKNPTKTTKAVHNIPARNRLVLTGTPIQNNLRISDQYFCMSFQMTNNNNQKFLKKVEELWALYDFSHQGTLLGSMKTFKLQYENPITRAREKDATVGEKRLGTEMAENLKLLIEPYFLRRTKAEIWGKPGENAQTDIDDLNKSMNSLKIANKVTTRKNDLIIWTFLSDAQCEIYQSFLHSDAVKMTLVSKRSPLVELTTLKKICDHPRLLSQRACLQLGLNGELKEEELNRELNDEASAASTIENVTDDTLIAESGKMKFLICLLANLKKEGHRALVFSLSRKILDMVHRILLNRGWKVMRLDGTVTKMEERERRIQTFQSDSSYTVFLLTTQVGGVGITLTAADRVVIYDPSWNPATDAQAVDRVYRIGQQKNVVVYRLITCGTVEEKIYRRQIFKDSITKQVTGTAADPSRYFSKQELRELFTLDNPHHSATQVQLSEIHSEERQSDVSLDEHIAFLHSLNIFGISDHDLMFTKDIVDPTEDNDEAAVSHDYIKKQVAMARELIRVEGSVVEEGMRLAGSYTKPYLENIPTFKKNSEKDLYKPPSVTQMNYPTLSPSPDKNDLENDSKQSRLIKTGESSRTSEVIDLCESPPKSKSASKYKESEIVPKSSRRSGKAYEPLKLEKNTMNNYFPVITLKEEEHASETGKVRLRSPGSDSPQDSTTPNKEDEVSIISVYETPISNSTDVAIDSVFKSATSVSPKASIKNINETSFDEKIASSRHSSTPKVSQAEKNKLPSERNSMSPNSMLNEKRLSVKNARFSFVDLEAKTSVVKDHSMLQEDGSDHDSSFEEGHSVMEADMSDHELSEIKDQSVMEEDMSDHELSAIKDQSVMEEEISVYNPSVTKNHSLLKENVSDHNLSLTKDQSVMEDYTSDHNTSLNKDQSMAEEEMSYHNSSLTKDQSLMERDMSVHNSYATKDQSMVEDYMTDDDTSVAKNEKSLTDFDPQKDTSMFKEEESCLSASVTPTSGESEKSSKFSFEAAGDSKKKSQTVNDSSLSENRSSKHLPSGDAASGSPSVQGASLSNTEDNMKKMGLSFDLDSSLYDDNSFNDQPAVIRNTRKSCAIQQPFIDYESDSSLQTSHPSTADNSEEEIIESDSEFSDSDPPNSPTPEENTSLSFVASSIPNSPYVAMNKTLTQNLSPRRRITPLRLRNSFVSPTNNPFAMAMATSPIFTPVISSPLPTRKVERGALEVSFSEEESPVVVRKAKKQAIISDSEED